MAGPSPKTSQQPMPRMTDSLAHQAGPGPSSLKLAALSANSYHLDSPPFTGTAGPLGESADEIDRLSSSLRDISAPSHDDAGGDQTPAAPLPQVGGGNGVPRERVVTSSSSIRSSSQVEQKRQSQVMQNGLREREEAYVRTHQMNDRDGDGDGDVPRWHLDDPQQQHNRASYSGHVVSHSLSPPPFSSAAQGPLASTSFRNSTVTSDDTVPAHGVGQRAHRRRESSRPSYTQISDSNSASNEDAASATADGDADVDANDDFYEAEVDGDDTAYIARSATGAGPSTPSRVPRQSQTKDEYKFPRHRLPTKMKNDSKIPLVIVACGSFSPPTYLHLRIFEMAKDQVIESGKYELLGGYYSPVSDYYKKEGLAKATHRVRMCELAVEKTSTWLMVDAWESLQDEYQRTAVVLDHFDEEINSGPKGGVLTSDGSRRKIRIMLLAGGDLIQSMGEPGVWADVDLNHILGKYGCMIVERTGADVWSFLLSHDLLWRYRRNLKIVKQTIFNDISSSKVRLFVRRGQSIKYLLPNSVIHYIEQHQLYRLPKELDTEPPDADMQHL